MNIEPGKVYFQIVRHDPWCPRSYGEGSICASGCKPITEFVERSVWLESVNESVKNRAERRKELREKGKKK